MEARYTPWFDEMTMYNMLLANALPELLLEEGILDRGEVVERLEKIKNEISVKKHRPH